MPMLFINNFSFKDLCIQHKVILHWHCMSKWKYFGIDWQVLWKDILKKKYLVIFSALILLIILKSELFLTFQFFKGQLGYNLLSSIMNNNGPMCSWLSRNRVNRQKHFNQTTWTFSFFFSHFKINLFQTTEATPQHFYKPLCSQLESKKSLAFFFLFMFGV